jgi:hypothetical protein
MLYGSSASNRREPFLTLTVAALQLGPDDCLQLPFQSVAVAVRILSSIAPNHCATWSKA